MTNCWLDRSGKFRAVQLFRCLPLHLLLGGRQEPAEAGLLLSICSISPEDESLGDEVGRVRGGRHRYGMVLCGERVDAATALRIRLVEEVVPRAQGAGRARCSLRLRQDHKAGHEVAAFDLSAGANERWGAEGLRIAACRA